MNESITLSIIIATFNSQKLLPKVLDSVKKQTYRMSAIEILVIDGGSSDSTLAIAKQYGCKILTNPKIVPAWAKYIGYIEAKGRYVMYLDSDEVIENPDSIQRKLDCFHKKSVRAVTGSGYNNSPGYIFLNQYINEFGDPFSFFFYRLTKDSRFFIKSMKRNYTVIHEDAEKVVFDFSNTKILPIFELVAMASIVDVRYLKKEYPEIIRNPDLIPHFFNLLVSKGSHIAIIKDDPLLHYSADTLSKYLGKIKSRIINNIYTPAKEGFNGRSDYLPTWVRLKKYLFVPYSLSIVFPLLDALYLAYTRKNMGYIVHVFLCLYTGLFILYTKGQKIIGIQKVLKSYGQQTTIKG